MHFPRWWSLVGVALSWKVIGWELNSKFGSSGPGVYVYNGLLDYNSVHVN